MAEKYLRQTPMAHLHLEARAVSDPGDAGVTLCEHPFRGQLALRGDTQDKAFVSGVEQVLGVAVPAKPNTVAANDDVSVLWLGPNEWLIVMHDGREQETMQALCDALVGRHFAVTDVSDSRAVIGLSGPHARDVLMKGCSLDLHPRTFGPHQCAQSALARCHMLLHQIDDAPTYDIYIHRSFVDYVWRWLEDAAQEYRLAIIATPEPKAQPAAAAQAEQPATAKA